MARTIKAEAADLKEKLERHASSLAVALDARDYGGIHRAVSKLTWILDKSIGHAKRIKEAAPKPPRQTMEVRYPVGSKWFLFKGGPSFYTRDQHEVEVTGHGRSGRYKVIYVRTKDGLERQVRPSDLETERQRYDRECQEEADAREERENPFRCSRGSQYAYE